MSSSRHHAKELPPEFLLLEQVATRWHREVITTHRLLRRFGVAVYRLTSRDHLYSLADIEAIERAARDKPPAPANNYPALVASTAKRRRKKEPADDGSKEATLCRTSTSGSTPAA
jgi:hypothetical protein